MKYFLGFLLVGLFSTISIGSFGQASVVAGSVSNSMTNYSPGLGNNRLLVVSVSNETNNNVRTITSITWGGQALTFGIAQNNGGSGSNDLRAEIWYLNETGINSAVSLCNDFIVTWSGAVTTETFSVLTLKDVDQATPVAATGSAAPVANNTVVTLSATAVGINDILVYASATRANSTHTPATGYTEHSDIVVGATTALATASKQITVAGNETPTATWSASSQILIAGVAFNGVAATGPITYYSRNATLGGNWDSNNSWTTNSDGSGGPLAAGIWPRRQDHVTILSGHTITINSIIDNKSCGVAPDDLPYANVGTFTSSNIPMFYQTGDITISGTLTITGIEMMVEGYTHILAGGTFSLGSTLVNVGYLEADATSTFTMLDDLALTGNSITIINTSSTSADDLLIDFTDATLCGTGATDLLNGAGSQITYTNGATVNQICTTFTVTCSGVGCTGFPVVGSGTPSIGNTGPGGVGVAQNNRIWLMGDRGTFSNAGTTPAVNLAAVQQWNDQSGNGNNALQNTLANRPIFRTGQDNGLPALEFTGDMFIDPPSLGVPGTGGFSYFVVFRDTQTGLGALNDGVGQFILDRTTATNPLVSLKPLTGNFYGFQKRTDAGTGLGGVLSSTSINTNIKWIEMERDRGATYGIYYNGVLENTIADTDGNLTPPIPRIGRHATTANGGLRGFLHEFFVYSSTINDAQRIIINNYVAAKYGMTIAANDLYTMDNPGNGNFDFDVAGVGQAADNSNHQNARGSGIVGVRILSPTSLTNGEFLLWGHDNGLLTGNIIDVDGTIIEERLTRIWRVSEVGDVGSVALSFDISSLSGSPIGSNLRLLIDRDGDGFADNDVSPLGGSTFSGDIITFTGVNLQNGDRFTLGNTDLTNPLPIELISFKAEPLEAEVRLTWSTASELNNDFFTVERSSSGEEFSSIGIVNGRGTTSQRNTYTLTDSYPLNGRSYYRLKQTDFDGTFTYSNIITITYDGPTSAVMQVYPNPSNGKEISIELTGLGETEAILVVVYDHLGREHSRFMLNSENNTGYILQHLMFKEPLPRGVYILKAGQTPYLTKRLVITD